MSENETTTIEAPEEVKSPAGVMLRIAAMKEAQEAMKLGMGNLPVEQTRHLVTQISWPNFLSAERALELVEQINEAEADYAATQAMIAEQKAETKSETDAIVAAVDGDEPPAPAVKAENRCDKCDVVIPPTGKRGRPAKHCATCKADIEANKPERKPNLCTVCNNEIPNTGKRGRQPSKHQECK